MEIDVCPKLAQAMTSDEEAYKVLQQVGIDEVRFYEYHGVKYTVPFELQKWFKKDHKSSDIYKTTSALVGAGLGDICGFVRFQDPKIIDDFCSDFTGGDLTIYNYKPNCGSLTIYSYRAILACLVLLNYTPKGKDIRHLLDIRQKISNAPRFIAAADLLQKFQNSAMPKDSETVDVDPLLDLVTSKDAVLAAIQTLKDSNAELQAEIYKHKDTIDRLTKLINVV